MGIGNLAVLHSRGLKTPQGIITTLEIPGDLSCPPVVCFTNPKQERTVCDCLHVADFRLQKPEGELGITDFSWERAKKSFYLPSRLRVGGPLWWGVATQT